MAKKYIHYICDSSSFDRIVTNLKDSIPERFSNSKQHKLTKSQILLNYNYVKLTRAVQKIIKNTRKT